MEQEQEQIDEDESELWEEVVNIVITAYENWMKKSNGDFGEDELKKLFTIKRIKN